MRAINNLRTRVSQYGLRYVLRVIINNKIYRPIDKTITSVEKVMFVVVS